MKSFDSRLSNAIDDSRRVMVVSLMFVFTTLHPTLPCPAGGLYRLANEKLLRPVQFTSEKEFRIFMASLADAGLVTEKHGRTMTAPTLEEIFFLMTPWLSILLNTTAGGAFQKLFAELKAALPGGQARADRPQLG